MVIYTDKLIPKRFAGYTIGPVILIRPSYRDDGPLLVHEKVHVKQFWRNPLAPFLMNFKKYRQRYEVEAYKAQIEAGADLVKCSVLLAENYKLNITYQKAIQLLS